MADDISVKMARRDLSPYLFFLIVLAVMMLNLLVVVYPLVIEGIVIGAPPPVFSGLDVWATHFLFGVPLSEAGLAYAAYIPFLIEVYLLSFLTGFLIGLRLLWPTFSKLLRNHELVASDASLAAKMVLDMLVFGWFGWLALTRILAYVMQYPGELYGVAPLCTLSGFIITGFLTGSCVGKSIPILWVYFACRKRGLKLISYYVEQPDLRGKDRRRKLVKWALMPTRK